MKKVCQCAMHRAWFQHSNSNFSRLPDRHSSLLLLFPSGSSCQSPESWFPFSSLNSSIVIKHCSRLSKDSGKLLVLFPDCQRISGYLLIGGFGHVLTMFPEYFSSSGTILGARVIQSAVVSLRKENRVPLFWGIYKTGIDHRVFLHSSASSSS